MERARTVCERLSMARWWVGLILLAIGMSYAGADDQGQSPKVATAPIGVSYFLFVEALQHLAPEQGFVNVATDGSYDNLDRIRRGEVDMAIVQSDAAHYTYFGKQGEVEFTRFRLMLPLFREYVQLVVRRDSAIQDLGDLQGKRINLGPERSGVRRNAVDVLSSAGFVEGRDYQSSSLPAADGFYALQNGKVDVMALTGDYVPNSQYSPYRQLRVPEAIINALIKRQPYYEAAMPPANEADSPPTLSVTAYFITSTDTPDATVSAVMAALLDQWVPLTARFPALLRLNQALHRSPAPFHRVVKQVLSNRGYIPQPYRYYWIAALWAVLGLAAYLAPRHRTNYNRMGEQGSQFRGLLQRVVDQVANAAGYVVSASMFFFLLSVVVIVIQWVEADYARASNVNNAFADIEFGDAVLWVFTFMASGFTSGNLYPLSLVGKILVAMLALIGVAGPLAVFFIGVEKIRRRNQRRRQGWNDWSHLRGHVLLCGWSEKCPGLVYTLTCDEVPEQRHIVVIADSPEDFPLDNYDFNERLVHYCRGDSVDHKVLDRAGAKHADVAIVVADADFQHGHNIRSVLATMALKKVNPKLFLVAEMIYPDNLHFFQASGADKLVTAEPILDRLAATACLNPPVVDFLLDMLTYDDHGEAYSVAIDQIIRPQTAAGLDAPEFQLGDVVHAGLAVGANVIGVLRSGGKQLIPAIGSRLGEHLITGDHIVYVALQSCDFTLQPMKPSFVDTQHRCADLQFPHEIRRVLLVGTWPRCVSIATQLHAATRIDRISILTEENINPEARPEWVSQVMCATANDGKTWERALQDETDCIVILSDLGGHVHDLSLTRRGDWDARTVLSAQLARRIALDAHFKPPKIVAEMIDFANRALFEDADIDVVIPESLIVERFLAKLVYSRGVVYEALTTWLNVSNDVHFMSYLAKSGDPYCGRSMTELLRSHPDDCRLVAWRPESMVDKLRNPHGDFQTHFVIDGDAEAPGKTVQPGDVLILLVDRPDRRRNNTPP